METTLDLKGLTGPQLLRALVGHVLARIEPTTCQLADGSQDDDTVHRVRVGLRRMRTLLRELGHLDDALDPQWEPALAATFRQLGQWRDRQHVLASLLPRLAQQGGPLVTLAEAGPADAIPPPRDLVAAPEFRAALAGLNAFATSAPGGPEPTKPARTRALVRKRLSRLHRQVKNAAEGFEELPAEAQHQARKRLKRLRYLAEFTAPLFDRDAARRYIRGLKPAQDALGLQNDEAVALDALRDIAPTQPQAWYGVGWLTARQAANARAGRKALKSATGHGRYWR